MFKNVLVGVDGRQGGRDAIALAVQLTDPEGKLAFVHVHSNDLRLSHAIAPDVAVEHPEASRELLEQELARAEVAAELRDVQATSPGRGLHEQVEAQGADLLVVGSCSHSAVGRAMLGDDTRGALNGAPCAVAIAPLGYAQRAKPIATIGVAYNFSPQSEHALAMARRLAAETGASICALEVVTIPSFAYAGVVPPAFGDSSELMLREADNRMKQLPGVEGRAVYGLAGEELAAFGDELDILVVGSRGYGPVKRLVLGSTCDYLERHARCSLLVLARAAPSESTAGAPASVGASAGAGA